MSATTKGGDKVDMKLTAVPSGEIPLSSSVPQPMVRTPSAGESPVSRPVVPCAAGMSVEGEDGYLGRPHYTLRVLMDMPYDEADKLLKDGFMYASSQSKVLG